MESVAKAEALKSPGSVIIDRIGIIWNSKVDQLWVDEKGTDHSKFPKTSVANAYNSDVFAKLDGDHLVRKYSVILKNLNLL